MRLKEPHSCVCLHHVWQTELQPVSLGVNLYKTPEAWEHSKIIRLSLHINLRLKEYESSACVCVREKSGGDFPAFVLHFHFLFFLFSTIWLFIFTTNGLKDVFHATAIQHIKQYVCWRCSFNLKKSLLAWKHETENHACVFVGWWEQAVCHCIWMQAI